MLGLIAASVLKSIPSISAEVDPAFPPPKYPLDELETPAKVCLAILSVALGFTVDSVVKSRPSIFVEFVPEFPPPKYPSVSVRPRPTTPTKPYAGTM